jgi:hypothetical protein
MQYILWDGRELSKALFEDAKTTPVIVQYNVTPGEVAGMNLDRLHVMAGSLTGVGAPARQSLLLCFAYDFDPRALDEIPEVVRYIKQIAAEIPNIWYFLMPQLNAHMFECLVPHTAITSPLFPKIRVSHEIPASDRRLVYLDLAAANKVFRDITEAVMRFGKEIGDVPGAQAVLREWHSVLRL